MADRVVNVLFLCTHNSARSVLAEAILTARGGGRYRGFSAGSFPSGRVNPFALERVAMLGLDTSAYRSKSWDEFARVGAPKMDYIFTVCDNAHGEVCPVWPGAPSTAHWGVPDPSSETGDDAAKRAAFDLAFHRLTQRIERFLALPLLEMSAEKARQELQAIGKLADAAPANFLP